LLCLDAVLESFHRLVFGKCLKLSLVSRCVSVLWSIGREIRKKRSRLREMIMKDKKMLERLMNSLRKTINKILKQKSK